MEYILSKRILRGKFEKCKALKIALTLIDIPKLTSLALSLTLHCWHSIHRVTNGKLAQKIPTRILRISILQSRILNEELIPYVVKITEKC